jgi:glycosyltransferase involved in cell wall biosynthesis
MTQIFLSTLVKLDYKVSIAEKTFSKTMKEVEKYPLKKILRSIAVVFKILCQFIIKRADLCFYFISIKPPSFYIDTFFLFVLRLLGTNTVLYVHGKGFLQHYERSFTIRWLLKSSIFYKLIGAIVLGEKLKKDIDFFIPNERLFVLPNCISDIGSKFSRWDNMKKRNGKIRILYLSNLVPDKGPIEFLKMARMVADKGKPVKFVLAGSVKSTSFYQDIMRLISDLKLTNDVEIVGAVYGAEKDKIFHDSDIFVFPTYYDLEAFPLVNLEAMRAGLPIVSSNEGSIPEMVIDGKNGYIVDPKNIEQLSDNVLRLVNDEELRIKMGKVGRKMYEKFFTTQAYEKRLNDGVKFFLKIDGLDNL